MVVMIAAILAAYCLGAFPTSYLVGRAVTGVDIRQHGSGNAGATNVARVVGKVPGLLVLFVDLGKGWVAAAPGAHWAVLAGAPASLETLQALCGLSAVCGHIWSPFLDFRGGKGVATAAGMLFGLSPGFGFAALLVWSLTAAMTRYVSISSIVAVIVVPVLMAATARPVSWVAASALLCVIIVAKHRANIVRLFHQQESRLGQKKLE